MEISGYSGKIWEHQNVRKNHADRVILLEFQIFHHESLKIALLCQNTPKIGQNTRYFDIPVEISVISEISIWQKRFFLNAHLLVKAEILYDA